MADANRETSLNECREPTPEDLARLCGALNLAGARYVVIGGFAMRAAGFVRSTMHVDLLVEPGLENEALVIKGMLVLPDKAAREKDAPDRLFLRELLEKLGVPVEPASSADVGHGRFWRWLESLFGGR